MKCRKKKLTYKKMKEFEKEERQTSKLYKSLGLYNLGKDEKSHSVFFKKMIKKCKK